MTRPASIAGLLLSILLWALLIAGACALSGCASIYAGELARDALAKCQLLAGVDFKGGRWNEGASTSINCLPAVPAPKEGRYATHP